MSVLRSHIRRGLALAVTLLAALLCQVAAAQTLIVAQGIEPETLDAQATSISAALNVSFQISERLVVDAGDGTLAPGLATKWGPAGDDRTWRFELRPNVRFTNGEPFDARAVKFSIERLHKPDPKWGSSVAHYVSAIQEVRVIDDLTVEMVTKDPFPLLPRNMVRVGMLPPQYTARVGNAAYGREPVGTGPFKLKEWAIGQYITLERNEDYWGARPAMDEIEFRAIPDAQTRVSALLSGDAHLVTNFPVQSVDRVKGIEDVEVRGTPSLRNMHLLVNVLADGPLKDKRVRQALNYAIDKQAIVDRTMRGYGNVLAGQTLTDFYFGFNPDLEPYPYDPAKARALLAEAGYPDGFTVEFAIPRGRYMNDGEIAQVVAAYLEAVGITVKVEPYEWAAYIAMLSPKKLPGLSLWGWAITVTDAHGMLLLNTSKHRFSYWRNEEFDELVATASRLSDDAKRKKLYRKATALMRAEAPNVFLHQQFDLYGVSRKVQGWNPRPDEFLDLVSVTLTP